MSKTRPPADGEVIRPPVAVRVVGVPAGSAHARTLLGRYRGVIDAFYLKCSRDYDAGATNQQGRHLQLPDLRLRYTNNQGQETLHIEIAAHARGGADKAVIAPETPWDWAVIDLLVPVFTHTYNDGHTSSSYSMFYCKLTNPAQLDTADGDPENGAAVEALDVGVGWNASAETAPIVQMAYSDKYTQVGTTNEVTDAVEWGSILIDVRQFHPYAELVFELYGSMATIEDDFVYDTTEQIGYYIIQRPSVPAELTDPATITGSSVLPLGSPDPYTDYRDESEVPGDYPAPYPQRGGGFDLAAPAAGTLTPFFYDLVGEMVPVHEPQGLSNSRWVFGDPDMTRWEFRENTLIYEFYKVYSFNGTPLPVTPSSAVEIRATMFRGDPHWAWSDNHDAVAAHSYARWEITERYPERFGTGVIGAGVPLTPHDPPVGRSNAYGLRLLGALHVSPKYGSVTFKPA